MHKLVLIVQEVWSESLLSLVDAVQKMPNRVIQISPNLFVSTVSHHWWRSLWLSDCHRAGFAWCQGGGD